jgi:hypothetical protein
MRVQRICLGVAHRAGDLGEIMAASRASPIGDHELAQT